MENTIFEPHNFGRAPRKAGFGATPLKALTALMTSLNWRPANILS